jgi:hypothetical protein
MARKTIDITITADGRDQGKTFRITEMSASQAEKWAMRAFLALAKSGVDVPDHIQAMGLAGIATIGIKAFGGLSWDMAEPLMDEMFSCIQIVMTPIARSLVESDIEEVSTRLKLRSDVFELHTGFSQAVARWKSAQAAAQVESDSPSTSTSPGSSAQ